MCAEGSWGVRSGSEIGRAIVVTATERRSNSPTPWWPGDEWRRRLEPTRVSLQSMTDGLRDSVEVFEGMLADPKLGTAARRQLEPMHALALFFAGRAKEAYAVVHRIRPPIPVRDQYVRGEASFTGAREVCRSAVGGHV